MNAFNELLKNPNILRVDLAWTRPRSNEDHPLAYGMVIFRTTVPPIGEKTLRVENADFDSLLGEVGNFLETQLHATPPATEKRKSVMSAAQQNEVVALLLAIAFDTRTSKEAIQQAVKNELAKLPPEEVAKAAGTPISFPA